MSATASSRSPSVHLSLTTVQRPSVHLRPGERLSWQYAGGDRTFAPTRAQRICRDKARAQDGALLSTPRDVQ